MVAVMGKSCCIEGCIESGPAVEHYKFPRSGSLRVAWIEATGCTGGEVCAAHFTPQDYKCERGTPRLRGTAVPSVFNKPPSSKENGEIASTDTPKEAEADTGKKVKAKAKNKKAKEKKNKEKSKPKFTENKVEDTTDSNKSIADKIDETIDENKVETTEKKVDDTIEKATINDRESSEKVVDTRQGVCEANGKNDKNFESAQPEVNDIEDMITNYQIKQTKTLADRLNPEPLEDLIPAIMAREAEKVIEAPESIEAVEANVAQDSPMPKVAPNKVVDVGQLASHLSNKLDDQLAQIKASAPVFIEVAVNQDVARAESPQDCVMLLESVQCDVDPSSLMLPEHGPDTDSDMEIIDADTKQEDPNPISLLTSSDEDEVIIEEPHIDTVEVSDETDEDDRPLQTLIRAAKPKPAKPEKSKKKSKFDWGYEFYCVQCDYRTNCEADFKQHNLELVHIHSTTIHVCPTCNYTTASKAQFSRHKRKHRDERNFKCHLCNYKARHNMSLIYHLKCHGPVEKKSETFTCEKCGFSSNVKSEALSHLKLKNCVTGNKYSCDQCSYSTKRRSDLRRHKLRRHSVDDSDEEFTI